MFDTTLSRNEIHPDFPKIDVVIIQGGSDIIGPGPEDRPYSPIARMTVLQVLKTKETIVMKRSLRSGYARVENPLFINKNKFISLGNAKESTDKLFNKTNNSSDMRGSTNVIDQSDVETPYKEEKQKNVVSACTTIDWCNYKKKILSMLSRRTQVFELNEGNRIDSTKGSIPWNEWL